MQRYDQLYCLQNIISLFVTLCMDSGEDAGQTKEKCLKKCPMKLFSCVLCHKKRGQMSAPE